MKLKIYKASAGSGKTHILARNYLLAAFDTSVTTYTSDVYKPFSGCMAFSRILAVTFTNKAAGEMKIRIIKELDDLILGKNSNYIQDIKNQYPSLSESDIINRAKKIRSAILHNYSLFNLRTIDSFVNRILRAFCYDINVNSGFRIELDNVMVLNDLCEMLYQRIDSDTYLRNQILKMSELNIEDGKNWDFRNNILSLAKLIFTENFKKLENLDTLKDDYNRKEFFASAANKLNNIYQAYLDQAKSIAKRVKDSFNSIFNQYCCTKQDLTKTVINLYNYFEKFNLKDINVFVPSKTIEKLLNNQDGYSIQKASALQKTIAPILYQKLNPLVDEYLNLYNTSYKKFVTASIILRDFYAFALLGDIASLMPQYRHDNQLMLISDATVFLNSIVKDNDAPFIYERTGNKFDHIFIDEFQDTSEFQWQNFLPLIQNTIALGFDNMIVGDVKQSIYRFRGGDWNLLNSEVEKSIGTNNIVFNTLDTNWRSRKNIVAFNNAVFATAVDILQSHDNGDTIDYNLIRKIYSDSFQNLPKNRDRSGGNVQVKFFEYSKSSSKKTNTDNDTETDNSFAQLSLKSMAQDIDTLLKQNYPPKKICILIRKGTEAVDVVNFLLDYMTTTQGANQYQIISADSLYIANAETVNVAINAIKVVVNNNNSIALAKLLFSYTKLANIDISDDEIFKAASNAETASKILPQGFNYLDSQFSTLPLYDLCENIISLFKLNTYQGETEYLRTFEDEVLNFAKKYSSDVARFVNWWDEKCKTLSIQPSDNQNAVTVMTVHKSKGLDFGAVFMPFCTWRMQDVNNTNANYIWVDPTVDAEFDFLPTLPVRYDQKLQNSIFNNCYNLEKRNLYVDSLNLLYVAFTRAVDELYIYCKQPNNNNIANVGDLLYYCITENCASPQNKIINLADYYNADTKQLSINEGHIVKTLNNGSGFKGFTIKPFDNCDWSKKLSIKYQSEEFFARSNPFIQEKINYGSFMHFVMSRIKTISDLPIVLQQLKDQGRITEAQLVDLKSKIESALAIDEVKRWFSPIWKQVITEAALLTFDGRIRIPDRVVVSDTETIIIDFKFGAHYPEYHAQIKEYADLIGSIKIPTFPNVSAYLFYVETSEIERVV